MKYLWICLLLAGCTSYSENRTSEFPFTADNESTIFVFIEGVDVATSRKTGQEAESTADLDAALSQMGATAAVAGKEAILEKLENIWKAETNQTDNNTQEPIVTSDIPVIEENNKIDPEEKPKVTDSIEDIPYFSEIGFVWKPISENDEKLVILLPTTYKMVDVSLEYPKDVTENGKYDGHANGNRGHYRFSKSGKEYPLNTTMVVDGKKYIVPDPSKRYENSTKEMP